MTFEEWRLKHPQAAADLRQVFVMESSQGVGRLGTDEVGVQNTIRLSAAKQGALSWRNNVGATKAKEVHRCPKCSFRFEVAQQPVRYGLANDSHQMNKRVKSSDLILAIPRMITPQMVGTTIAQFGAIECKHANWVFTGSEHEVAQMNYLQLVAQAGGFATFATGAIQL